MRKVITIRMRPDIERDVELAELYDMLVAEARRKGIPAKTLLRDVLRGYFENLTKPNVEESNAESKLGF